uniref:CCHC-type domain-containing protein n=1 Tax=Cannabis sativa TaxID=3483 RepID=A0A803PM29_CANSA
MNSFHSDISQALTEKEKEVVKFSNISAPLPRSQCNKVYCKIFSKRGHNSKQFFNFVTKNWTGRFPVETSSYDTDVYMISFGCQGDLLRVLSKEPWRFQNQHLVLCLPSVLQNASLESFTITPFWIQVYRLPFLSKSEDLARNIGGLIGNYIDVHEDSLNEGWGPFLRIRVGIDVSKPLLRGQMVAFPWIKDELWLEFRYERLPNFCYECGIIGHVFNKCQVYLEKIDDGKEPDLPYGPWMEGSPLLKSPYDRYRQDFSKAGPWPFVTRLVRNTISPIIKPPRQPPALPPNVTDREKGKEILLPKFTDHEYSSLTPSFAALSCGLNHFPTDGNSLNDAPITEKCISTPFPSASSVKKGAPPQCQPMYSRPESSGVKCPAAATTIPLSSNLSSKAAITTSPTVVLSTATPPAYFHLSEDHSSGSSMMTMPLPSATNIVPLSSFSHDDKIIWHHETTGIYTVKSGYILASKFADQEAPSVSSHSTHLWKQFWKLNIPSKVRIFLWKVVQECLPVAAILQKCHIAGSAICSLCRGNNESIFHALFLCKRAKKVWRGSSFSLDRIIHESSNFKDLFFKASETWPQQELEQFACILWSIWTERNKEYHGTKPKPNEVLLVSAISYLGEYQASRQATPTHLRNEVHRNNEPTVAPKWLNPPSDRLKLNTDAAVDTVNRISSFGAILRDSDGQVVAGMSKPHPGCFKPEVMEALALRYSLQWLQSMNLPIHYIETDSLLVVKGLQARSLNVSDFHSVLNDISILMSNFPGVQISHVFRSANTFAHILAKYALSVDKECIWMEEIPPPLMTIVL